MCYFMSSSAENKIVIEKINWTKLKIKMFWQVKNNKNVFIINLNSYIKLGIFLYIRITLFVIKKINKYYNN